MAHPCYETAKESERRALHRYAHGGRVADELEDKRLVAKGVHQHEDHEHEGKHTSLKLRGGGKIKGEAAKQHLGRRARGGRTKGPSRINIVIATGKDQDQQHPAMPPMPPPGPPPGGPPPGGAPGMPPGGMPPGGAMRPPMKRGGRAIPRRQMGGSAPGMPGGGMPGMRPGMLGGGAPGMPGGTMPTGGMGFGAPGGGMPGAPPGGGVGASVPPSVLAALSAAPPPVPGGPGPMPPQGMMGMGAPQMAPGGGSGMGAPGMGFAGGAPGTPIPGFAVGGMPGMGMAAAPGGMPGMAAPGMAAPGMGAAMPGGGMPMMRPGMAAPGMAPGMPMMRQRGGSVGYPHPMAGGGGGKARLEKMRAYGEAEGGTVKVRAHRRRKAGGRVD